MELKMQESEDYSKLSFHPFQIAFTGNVVDDRGAAADPLVRSNSENVIPIESDPADYPLHFDTEIIHADALHYFLAPFRGLKILLESTTLGFVEIFLSTRSFHRLGIDNFHILYVEPQQYKHARRTALLNKRDFDLSDEVPGYRGFPGATMMLTDKEIQRGSVNLIV